MKLKKKRMLLVSILVLCMVIQPIFAGMPAVYASQSDQVVIDATDYGADPTGVKDSTRAIQAALEAAKEAGEDGTKAVTLTFPKGEYHIYKDYAEKREYHTSNTNSIQSPEKTIGILIEEQKNLTVDGKGSLFMMHGNMMALAVVKSENITLQDFSWDFAVPTVSEMTITGMGEENGKQYTDFFIPKCFPFEIKGTTIQWNSEPSPYTGEYYWTETGIHNAYSIVAYHPDEEMTRAYFTSDSPFSGVSSIQSMDDTTVRITYNSSRPAMQKTGMILELASSAYRETAGAFTWESENVTARRVNVHFMHGFGWLVQMSRDVYYYDCNMMPRENSGHVTVGYADGIHASGAAGDLVIEGCNFANTHDDPINLHGTFTRVEQRVDDHTLKLKYIHTQQGGFPQFHKGDKVAFFTRDTLESTDGEQEYTVAEVISNPGEGGNDLRTMEIRFEEALPANLSDTVSGQPKYVAENVTYAPRVTIRNCTFKYVPTRGILCTTRNKVLIENNTFLNMSMATIYLSNDSDEWYESGPIRDMTIRNNTFYIKNIGRTSWEYAPAVYIHPVTKGGGLPSQDNPIHKNITIEGNTFHMDVDTVVKAESVENLTIRNNKILRTNPDVEIKIEAGQTELLPGENTSLTTNAAGDTHTRAQDNVYEFTKCKNVILEGNTYDDGLKRYAVVSGMSEGNLQNKDSDIKVVTDRNQAVTEPVRNIRYASTDPEVASVNAKGQITAKKEGTASVFAYYHWNDTVIRSNQITLTVGAGGAADGQTVSILGDDNVQLKAEGQTHQFQAEALPMGSVKWTVEDFETGNVTEAASIDADGILTARKNGIVWVKASVGQAEDKKAVIITLPETDGLNPAFSIKREEASSYTLEKDRVQITMQTGDLYQTDNNVKNLFLYQIPNAIPKDQMRTVVKVDNLPLKESGYWDTGSFLLYKDDDNYISIGKKSHYNGIASVVERQGAAVETGGNASENAVSTAYLGFYKNGDQVSLDFKLENGTWQHAADLDASLLGSDYQIGFATWGNASRAKKLTFSEFRVGSGDMTYEALLEQAAVELVGAANQAPAAEGAAFGAEEYRVGDRAEVSFRYSDPEGDAQGRTLYRFSYEDGTEEVTANPHTILKSSGTVDCFVYPADVKGTPGMPAKASSQVLPGEGSGGLQELLFNGTILYESGDTGKEFRVSIPTELEKAEVSFKALAADQSVQILVDGKLLEGTWTGSASVTVPVSGDGQIQVKLSEESIYTIHVEKVEDNAAWVDEISIPELDFQEEQPEQESWFLNADSSQREAELLIEGNDRIGTLCVLRDEYRSEMELTSEGNQYRVPLTFENGINSFYIQVKAKDGITTKQYMVHVNYAASTGADPEMIRIAGTDLAGFSPEVTKYLVHLDDQAASTKIEVMPGSAAAIRIAVNGVVTEGTQATVTEWQPGRNEILVLATASDGIHRNVYQIDAFMPDASSAELYDIRVDQNSILEQLTAGEEEVFVSEDTVNLRVQAQDFGASIEVSNGQQTYRGTGSLEQNLKLYQETSNLKIKVTSKDGTNTQTQNIRFKKAAYLSDLKYNGDATVGYGTIMLDKASSGNGIRLTGEDGNPVSYEKGIGTHADSVITYNLEGKSFKKLTGLAGVDYGKNSSQYAAITFTIQADGNTVFENGPMRGSDAGKAFEIDLTGVSQLTLKAVQASNNWDAHADWADMKLSAEFDTQPSVKKYQQTIVQAANGKITSSIEGEIPEGSSVTYTFTPDSGYRIKQALVNGKEVKLENGTYTVPNVTEDLTVTAVFEKIQTTYQQTIVQAANGRITSSAEGELPEGSSVTYTFTPDSGYRIKQALVNGKEVKLENGTYMVPNVTEDLRVTAVFEKIQTTYQQTILQAANGKITSSIEGKIPEGENVTYTFTPDSGYRIRQALVNGKEVKLENGTYMVPNVTEDLKVTAVFEKISVIVTEYTASFTGGAGASGTAPAAIKGAAGSIFRLPANSFAKAGYQFAGWSDGKAAYAPGSAYTMPSNEVLFTASWVKIPGQVKGLTMKKRTASSIKVNWKAVSGATGYELQRTVKGKKNWKTVKTVTGTSYTDQKLASGTAYTYRVRAYTASQGIRAYGKYSASLQTATRPAKPKLKAKAFRGYVRLTWKKKTGAQKFEIYQKKGNEKFQRIKRLGGKKTSYKVKTVKGATYTFRIRGVNQAGKGKKIYSPYSRKLTLKAK